MIEKSAARQVQGNIQGRRPRMPNGSSQTDAPPNQNPGIGHICARFLQKRIETKQHPGNRRMANPYFRPHPPTLTARKGWKKMVRPGPTQANTEKKTQKKMRAVTRKNDPTAPKHRRELKGSARRKRGLFVGRGTETEGGKEEEQKGGGGEKAPGKGRKETVCVVFYVFFWVARNRTFRLDIRKGS